MRLHELIPEWVLEHYVGAKSADMIAFQLPTCVSRRGVKTSVIAALFFFSVLLNLYFSILAIANLSNDEILERRIRAQRADCRHSNQCSPDTRTRLSFLEQCPAAVGRIDAMDGHLL